LGRVKRVSGVASFAGLASTFDYGYAGEAPRNSDLDEYALQFLGGAFPVPVLRGSLVPAIGVERLFTSSLDLSYQGFNTPDDREDRLSLRQTGATYAYHVGAAIDLSGAFSVGADLMVLDGNIDRIRQYDTRYPVASPNLRTFVYEDMHADVDGWGARFGLEFYALEHLQIAVVATTPLSVEVEGSTVTEETRQVDNDVGSFTSTTTSDFSEYGTPYRIDGAFALPLSPAFLLCAQVGFADWSKATIDEERLLVTETATAMRDVVDLRAGAEWTLARWPLRMRAGFAFARSASAYLEADRIDDDRLEPIDEESETTAYSLGFGYLLHGSLALDGTVVYARGERASETIDDTRTVTSVSIGCGYWF
jgi:long-subunit fatty acid transport protein